MTHQVLPWQTVSGLMASLKQGKHHESEYGKKLKAITPTPKNAMRTKNIRLEPKTLSER